MVGLKTFWMLIIGLMMLSACVPQTKQTGCRSNEAFNATLRTCVPVMQGPSSFISIDSYLPLNTLTKYKNDAIPVNFSITISNPYDQTYTVEWERIFNGSAVPITPDTETTYALAPILLASEVGLHVISVKILDTDGEVVDSHTFELKINDLPLPVINSAFTSPIDQNVELTPLDADQTFSLVIKNNGATIAGAGYRTDWTISKNGVNIGALAESDVFVTTTTTGTNNASFVLNPDGATNGVGSYTLRARVTNTAADIVDEQIWYIDIQNPDLSLITSRNLYAAPTTTPSFSTVVTAYNGVAYSASTSYNFIPVGESTQANFCVTVADGDGTYPGDGDFVRVDYYLDSTTLIYSGLTSAVDDEVCLSDAPGATEAAIMFTNPNATSTVVHQITARVVDEYTGTEYTSANMSASLGSYPLAWTINVKPANAAPTVTFTADTNLSGMTCSTAVGTARTCTVVQDAAFTLGVNVVDDFYDTSSTTDSEQNKIAYSMILYRNGSAISTCSKTYADVANTNVAGTDFVGPDYLCSFTAASYDVNGSINPASYSYSVSITVTDLDSPISGSTSTTSAVYTYNLNVTEVSTAPTIDAQGATTSDSFLANSTAPTTVLGNYLSVSTITEGETLNLNVLANDSERDDHQVNVYLCTDFALACTTTSLLATTTVNKTDNVLGTTSTLTYAIPENLVPVATAIGTLVDTFFKIVVTDVPDSLSGQTATAIFSTNVLNRNPAPQFGGTPSPATATALTTMVGYPLSIDPGTVTDASLVATENVIQYQWYIDADGGANAFTAITGATSRILNWTPSAGIATGTIVNLRLCVHDGTTPNPLPASAVAVASTTENDVSGNGANCRGNWNVTVRPNANALTNAGATGTDDMDADVAVWQDTTVSGKRIVYTAYSDASGNIFIEKTVFTSAGLVYTASNPGFETVSFAALNGATVAAGSIKDISLAGNSEYLYIAYQAADSSTPSSPKIRVRRIDKRTGATAGSKSDTSYPDTGKFGYVYTQAFSTNDADAAITMTGGSPYVITFSGAVDTTDTITIAGVTMEAEDSPAATELCSGGGACTTVGNATRLASFINASSDRDLQGLTAVAAGSSVSIYGALGNESLDVSATVSNYIVGKLGKIVMDSTGTNWYLPFVDLSTAGTLSRIRVLSAPTSAASTLQSITPDDTVVYTTIGAVNYFTNEINLGDQMVIGSINTSSVGKIHIYSLAGALVSSKTLFGGARISTDTVRLSTSVTGNSYTYAVAKVETTPVGTYEWYIGRYDASLATSVEDKFSTLAYNAATTTVMDDSEVIDVSLQTMPVAAGSSTEARLMVASLAGGATVDLYSVRFKSDNKLSCDQCLPHNIGTQELSSLKRVASTKIDFDMTIGTAGSAATPSENVKDVLFTAYSIDTASDGIFVPYMSIVNIEAEAIQSTTTDTSGTIGHRPPFIGSN